MAHAIAQRRAPLRGAGALAVCIGLCLGAGALGSVFTSASVRTWYPLLVKPAWTPPPWLFGPVWTALYLAMAVACFRIWRRRDAAGSRAALGLFAVQLALNVLWSALFFGLRRPDLGVAGIVALFAAIAATLAAFARVDRPAAWLLAPYLAWVGFASALNVAIWRLN